MFILLSITTAHDTALKKIGKTETIKNLLYDSKATSKKP